MIFFKTRRVDGLPVQFEVSPSSSNITITCEVICMKTVSSSDAKLSFKYVFYAFENKVYISKIFVLFYFRGKSGISPVTVVVNIQPL